MADNLIAIGLALTAYVTLPLIIILGLIYLSYRLERGE